MPEVKRLIGAVRTDGACHDARGLCSVTFSTPPPATVTLTDAGPRIALIDEGEPDHELCRETLDGLELPPNSRSEALS